MSGVGRTVAIAGATGLTVGLLGGAVVWGVLAGKPSEWWAAWGQWVGGIGSIAAAVVALWIAWQGWARADGERRAAEADQARLVTAEWRFEKGTGGRLDWGYWGVFVDNHSPRLILDVAVERIDAPYSAIPGAWSCAGGWGEATVESVPPYESRSLGVRFERAEEENRPMNDPRTHGRVYVTFSFTDADGRRWIRTSGQPPQRSMKVITHPVGPPPEASG